MSGRNQPSGKPIMDTSTASSETPLPGPTPGSNLPRGTVQVSVLVPVSINDAWSALTRRDVVAQWFGDLSESLNPGGPYRLDFGDGDFFEITDVDPVAPNRLSYCWRFLGTGPKDAISWSINPSAGQCSVTVTDTEDGRAHDAIEEMTEGWTDFLHRLQVYCATGQKSRYGWRKEFSGSIELPVQATMAFDTLLDADRLRHWAPWSGDALTPGARVTMTDNRQPAQLTIGAVDRTGPLSLRFTLTCRDWNGDTECSLQIESRPHGALLMISHVGWQGISSHESEQAAQRARFGTLWEQALRAGQQFVSQSSAGEVAQCNRC
jgi:uncharacterized protein YndB with AHSA1/START domain